MTLTLARTIYLNAPIGVPQDLPRAGCALEHPLVFDAAARELITLAEMGKVRVLEPLPHQLHRERLIERLRFERVS